MSVDVHFRNAARRHADRVALIDGERRWTFGEFMRDAARLAAGLAARLRPGERVVQFMANRAEFLLLQVAIERAGLVRVPVNARYTAFEVANLLADCEASAMFFDADTAERAAKVEAPGLWRCRVDDPAADGGPNWTELMAVDPSGDLAERADLDRLCSLNYTSGTSGRPKGVMLSHRNWRGVYRNMLVDRDIRGDDVLAHIGPLTHASGTYFTPYFVRGATSVIVPGGRVEGLLEAIERHRVTAFTCVPTVLTRIVNAAEADRFNLASLRAIGYGAEAIQANTLEKALRRFGPILTNNYGLTEAMMTCTRLLPHEHLRPGDGDCASRLRLGCIGRPYTFVDIVLRDPQGRPVARGEVGEITIQAEHVMRGYWRRPDETRKVLRDGWLWSGDLARMDEEGFITLAGRSKELLISGGFNIYPSEVEACLSACPGVVEAAVIGIPDAEFGEVAVAIVVADARAEVGEGRCVDYCRPRLGFKTPKRWMFVDHLPRTANGKVDKAELRRLYAPAEAVP